MINQNCKERHKQPVIRPKRELVSIMPCSINTGTPFTRFYKRWTTIPPLHPTMILPAFPLCKDHQGPDKAHFRPRAVGQ